MGNYIFRFPEVMPRFDAHSLETCLGERDSRRVGTTVTVTRLAALSFAVKLYDTVIAYVGAGSVTFMPDGDDAHMATTEWVSLIARHNGIARGACRQRNVLWLEGRGESSPAVRRTYPVNSQQAALEQYVKEQAGKPPQVPRSPRRSPAASGPHRVISYAVEYDSGLVYSRVGNECAVPVLDFEAIGRGGDGFEPGDFRGPMRYELTKMSVYEVNFSDLRWTRHVPVRVKNLHREFWGFKPLPVPEEERSQADALQDR
jgi:hypothetical protein